MILTRELEYAIQLLSAMGEGCFAPPLSLKKFAKESGISFLFLQQIARKLKAANIILARKGRVGGYWLSKKRAEISLKDVIRAIDGHEIILPHAVKKLNHELINFLETKKISEYAI